MSHLFCMYVVFIDIDTHTHRYMAILCSLSTTLMRFLQFTHDSNTQNQATLWINGSCQCIRGCWTCENPPLKTNLEERYFNVLKVKIVSSTRSECFLLGKLRFSAIHGIGLLKEASHWCCWWRESSGGFRGGGVLWVLQHPQLSP